jgi:ferrochelatase
MRRAIVLMNLGAPDRPEAVRPFLTNLFSDPAIIDLPAPLRWPLARLIARGRAKTALDIYSHLGGGSPLLKNTEAQARALEAEFDDGSRCFMAMRYWHPLTEEAVAAVKEWAPDEIVCLPLYPQFSTTTTGSSLAAWGHAAAKAGISCPTRTIESYPAAPGLIAALAGLIAPMLDRAADKHAKVRLLLSAHGLPEKIVRAGDPYPEEIAQTAAAIVTDLARPKLEWTVCYQSRVGPLKWLGPLADEEIRRAGNEDCAVVIAPISFVSEHSETLVELDRDYRRLAEKCGVPGYYRVPALGTDPRFIATLAALVREAA